MRNSRLLIALLAAGALTGAPSIADAACVGAISLGETNATETAYAGNLSSPGSILTIRGVVDCFSDPVASCTVAGYEYTIVYTGTSGGTATTPGVGPGGAWTAYTTHYGGGSFTIYEDPTPDADPAVPGSYTDGAVFLTGTVGDLLVQFFLETATSAYKGGNFDSGISATFTGGSGFACVSRGGAPCPLRLTGGWNVTPGALQPGYTAEVAGKLDVQCPTPAVSSTVGRVKGIYR
jgi:hypothetical protein